MNIKIIRVFGLLAALAGLLVLMLNTSLTQAASHAILSRNDGGMDTNTWMVLTGAAADAYRVLGAVLLGVGLFRATQPDPH